MRMRTTRLMEMKQAGERIACITAYDYPTACLVDQAGFPLLLVGDSLGNVVLGHESTIPVTMDDMVRHTAAVARGVQQALVVADMPFMTYHESAAQALRNAGRLIQEGGAQAVKLEGGERIAATLRSVVEAGVPAMGHIGLTPQSVHSLGGYRVQGRTLEDAVRLVRDAEALEQAGAFAVVLETVPAELAARITQRLSIPTIGIGAGPHCNGEIQVLHEVLGLVQGRIYKHAKAYADLNATIAEALARYRSEVVSRHFPGADQSFELDAEVARQLDAALDAASASGQ